MERQAAEPRAQALLLTVVEAARLLAVGRTTIYELIRSGELRTVRIGRARRVPLTAIADYVAGLEDGIHNATPRPYAPDVRTGGGVRGVG